MLKTDSLDNDCPPPQFLKIFLFVNQHWSFGIVANSRRFEVPAENVIYVLFCRRRAVGLEYREFRTSAGDDVTVADKTITTEYFRHHGFSSVFNSVYYWQELWNACAG